MKTLKQTITEYLETEPKARERRNKDRAIVNLLLERHQSLKTALEQHILSKDELITMVGEFASLDRLWRKALEENPHLRGEDYDDKDQLEQEKMAEMGYHTDRVGPMEAVEREIQPSLI